MQYINLAGCNCQFNRTYHFIGFTDLPMWPSDWVKHGHCCKLSKRLTWSGGTNSEGTERPGSKAGRSSWVQHPAPTWDTVEVQWIFSVLLNQWKLEFPGFCWCLPFLRCFEVNSKTHLIINRPVMCAFICSVNIEWAPVTSQILH